MSSTKISLVFLIPHDWERLAYFLTNNNADPIPHSHWRVIQFRTHHRTCEDACKTGTSKHEIRSRVIFPLISCNYIKGMRVLFSCCSYSDTYFWFWGVVRCVDMVTHAWKRLKYDFKFYQLCIPHSRMNNMIGGPLYSTATNMYFEQPKLNQRRSSSFSDASAYTCYCNIVKFCCVIYSVEVGEHENWTE